MPLPAGKTVQADDSNLSGAKKWNELTDVELRYRQRYVELVVNPEVREVFLKRSKLVQSLRRDDGSAWICRSRDSDDATHRRWGRGAPIHDSPQHTRYGFIPSDRAGTLFKAAGRGRIHRVYEINRNFRNEGLGWRWNPEFTMLESYQAYTDYQGIMDLSRS